MKVLFITDEAYSKLIDYQKWSNSDSISKTINLIDDELQSWLPKDSIYKRSSYVKDGD